MIPLLVLGGLLLVSGPGLIPVRAGHPVHWSRNALAVQLTGFALVQAGLLLWAAPALLDLMGATDLARICRRMYGEPALGGWPAGTAAGVAAVVMAGLGIKGAWQVRSTQRRMHVEPLLGVHHRNAEYDLVVLPAPAVLAYSIGGRCPQVVISQGLVDTVGDEMTDAVCAHEAVHVRYGHHRFVAALGAISSAFGWLPPARRSVESVRLAMERWADEEASEMTSIGRDGVRRALMAVTFARLGPDVVTFGSADTIIERARALSDPPPRSSALWAAAGHVTVWLAATTAAVSLVWATGMSVLAVANPGLCVL